MVPKIISGIFKREDIAVDESVERETRRRNVCDDLDRCTSEKKDTLSRIRSMRTGHTPERV